VFHTTHAVSPFPPHARPGVSLNFTETWAPNSPPVTIHGRIELASARLATDTVEPYCHWEAPTPALTGWNQPGRGDKLVVVLLRFFFPALPGRPLTRYTFAFVCWAIAFAARLLLDPVLQDRSPLLLFTFAVAVSAMRGGFGPGVFSVLLGVLGALYFFPPMGAFFNIDPQYRLTGSLQLVLFVVVGVILSWLSDALRRERMKAMALAQERKEMLESLRKTLGERDAAMENVRLLSGLLPICAGCKKIRDDAGRWQQMESYISAHSQARFSHGMCPDCARRYYDELNTEPQAKK
jgi:hypothetical protein